MTRLTDWQSAEGKTIQSVFEFPDGIDGRHVSLIMAFTDGDWLAVTDGCRAVNVSDYFIPYSEDIARYVAPETLMNAGLINPAQCDYLIEAQRQERIVEVERELRHLKEDAALAERELQKMREAA